MTNPTTGNHITGYVTVNGVTKGTIYALGGDTVCFPVNLAGTQYRVEICGY